MRGIRIWHLAALALTVPLLAANAPSGCTGLFNPNFISGVMGGDGASAGPATQSGYVVLAFFNYTGWPGHVTFGIVSEGPTSAGGRVTGWNMWLSPDKPEPFLWACDQYLWQIDLTGGEIFVPDPTTGIPQPVAIDFDGGILGGKNIGDPLECGTLIKANVRYVNATDVRIDVELIK